MKQQFKIGLYVVTVVGTFVFGSLFLQGWRRASDRLPAGGAPTRVAGVGGSAGATQGVVRGAAGTASEPAASPGAPGGSVAAPGSEASAIEVTNGVAEAVHDPAVGEAESEPEPEHEPVPMQAPGAATRGLGRMIVWGLLAVVSLIGAGVLAAYDVSQYAAHRATQALFNDQGEEPSATEYEMIEKVHGEGDYLEAVRMLREFLGRKPREVHAQIRIAEIYEKDLNNPLAAALEYEEVLKQPLDLNRRGWTGIHLVNLYNRLDKPAQAVALMQQICLECPDTPAAGKARERLAAMGETIPESPGSAGGAAPGDPGLPPGFRKKR
jgi:hypothetical protein